MNETQPDIASLRTLAREFEGAADQAELTRSAFLREMENVGTYLNETDPGGRLMRTWLRALWDPNPPPPKPARGPGRPTGSQKHVELRSFVGDLLTVVAAAGGKLSFDKNYPERGTLLPALQLLAPYLPPRVIFELPPSVLAETCTKWRASHRMENWDALRGSTMQFSFLSLEAARSVLVSPH